MDGSPRAALTRRYPALPWRLLRQRLECVRGGKSRLASLLELWETYPRRSVRLLSTPGKGNAMNFELGDHCLLVDLKGRRYPVSYTHLRAHETDSYLVCRLLLEKKKKK